MTIDPGYAYATCQHGAPLGHTCTWCVAHLASAASQTLRFGGWECPRCHTCWSPSVTRCTACPTQVIASPVPEHDLCLADDECVPPEEGGTCAGGRHCSC